MLSNREDLIQEFALKALEGPVVQKEEGIGYRYLASQVALVVKNLPASAGDMRLRFDPGSGRSPGGGHGNPLQYSCPENPMDRGSWWATVHGVAQSWTGLSDLACI